MTLAPSKVLAEIQMMLVAELVAQSGAVVLDRRILSIIQAAIGEIVTQVSALEERAAAVDAYEDELKISAWDRRRLEAEMKQHFEMLSRPWNPTGKGRLEASHRRGAEVTDLGAIRQRKRRDAARSRPSDGGETA